MKILNKLVKEENSNWIKMTNEIIFAYGQFLTFSSFAVAGLV